MTKTLQHKEESAIKILEATRRICQQMVGKFPEGSSQHSLLRNRIQALLVAETALQSESSSLPLSLEELTEALPRLYSILRKCRKGQEKHEVKSATYQRLQGIIQAMETAVEKIETRMEEAQKLQLPESR